MRGVQQVVLAIAGGAIFPIVRAAKSVVGRTTRVDIPLTRDAPANKNIEEDTVFVTCGGFF